MKKIEINREISPHLAFVIILSLSFLVSWYTVSRGKKLAEELKSSQITSMEKRTVEEVPEK